MYVAAHVTYLVKHVGHLLLDILLERLRHLHVVARD